MPNRQGIGPLNRMVIIESTTYAASASGAMIPGTWSEYARVSAAINTSPGDERGNRGVIEGGRTWEMTTHYRPGITDKMRVRYDSSDPTGTTTRYLNIESVENVNEANQWLRLICVEGRTQGK